MDTRNIAEVFVPKNCLRTDGSDTLDGTALVTGTQIWTKYADGGVPATTYFGPGELVITDLSGKVLTTATALKSIEDIQLHFRSFDGKHKYASKPLKGKDITGYTIQPYKAAQECVVEIATIAVAAVDTVYNIRMEVEPSPDRKYSMGCPYSQVISYRVKTGDTAATIAAALAAEINTYFSPGVADEFWLNAYVNTAATGIVIEALPNDWDIEKFPYNKTLFKVFIDFDATIVTNLHALANTTINAVAVPPATKGSGTYEQVAEMEWFGQGYQGYNRDLGHHSRIRTVVPLSAQPYESDNTTPMGYDVLVINWNYTANHTLTGTNQRGSIVICLPVEDNGASQVNDIVTTLDKYIATEYGVSAAQVAKLT